MTHTQSGTPTWAETFGYDEFGNINHINRNGAVFTFAYDPLNRIQQEMGPAGQTNYTYDDRGNRQTFAGTALPPLPEGEQTFTYNALNELKTFASSTGVTASYTYYGDGLRATRTVNGNFTRYVYWNGHVIEELDASGNVKARNIWGNELLSAGTTRRTVWDIIGIMVTGTS